VPDFARSGRIWQNLARYPIFWQISPDLARSCCIPAVKFSILYPDSARSCKIWIFGHQIWQDLAFSDSNWNSRGTKSATFSKDLEESARICQIARDLAKYCKIWQNLALKMRNSEFCPIWTVKVFLQRTRHYQLRLELIRDTALQAAIQTIWECRITGVRVRRSKKQLTTRHGRRWLNQ